MTVARVVLVPHVCRAACPTCGTSCGLTLVAFPRWNAPWKSSPAHFHNSTWGGHGWGSMAAGRNS